MQRDINVDRSAMLVLRLPEANPTISYMLRPEPDRVFPAPTRVEKEIKRQTGLAAEWMPVPILCDLLRRPRVMAVRRILDLRDAPRGVLRGNLRSLLAGPGKQGLQRLQGLVGSARLICPLITKHADVPGFYSRDRFFGVVLANGVQRPAPPCLG